MPRRSGREGRKRLDQAGITAVIFVVAMLIGTPLLLALVAVAAGRNRTPPA